MTRFHLIVLITTLLVPTTNAESSDAVSFRDDVAPILLDHCVACHGAKTSEGGYRVDTYDQLRKPGDSGETPIATKADESSELLRRLTCEDESERMPAESDPLTGEQIAKIKAWIDAGASFNGSNSADPLALVIPALQHADPPETYPQPIPITAVCFTPDGKALISSGYHELNLWDTSTGKLIRRIKNVGQRVFAIELNHDGDKIAVGCGEPGRSGELRLIDFASGKVIAVAARTTDVVTDVAFRSDNAQVAVASADGIIRLVDAETLEVNQTFAGHADVVTALSWNHDGSQLVSASRDKSAKVFDIESGQLLASYTGHGAPVRGVSFLHDGKQIVSTGADKRIHRWNAADAKQVAATGIGATGFKTILGDQFVIVPCADHRLRRFNLADNKIAQEFEGHSDWALSAVLNKERTQLASGSFNGEVRIWDIATGSLLQSWIAKP
jgi:WD40 repeat protein/mono/diheme cytochrome c family protein